MRTIYRGMTTKGRMRGEPMLGLLVCRLPFVRLRLQGTLVDVYYCKIVYSGILKVQQVVEQLVLRCDDGGNMNF